MYKFFYIIFYFFGAFLLFMIHWKQKQRAILSNVSVISVNLFQNDAASGKLFNSTSNDDIKKGERWIMFSTNENIEA